MKYGNYWLKFEPDGNLHMREIQFWTQSPTQPPHKINDDVFCRCTVNGWGNPDELQKM
jgi:hypothetical protein